MLLAAMRPIGDAPLELSLYGTRDPKSKGKTVCQASIPLAQLLAVAGVTGARNQGSAYEAPGQAANSSAPRAALPQQRPLGAAWGKLRTGASAALKVRRPKPASQIQLVG